MLDSKTISDICLTAIVIVFFICLTVSNYFKYKYTKNNDDDDNMKEG